MGNVSEFFKLLVEWGDVYTVDSEDNIVTTSDNQPVMVDINGNILPLKVFSDKMTVGKHTFFNPLVKTLGHSSELSWFFTTRSMILGNMIKAMMIRVIELAIDTEEEVDYDKLELIQPFMDKSDKKLISEIEQLQPNKILRIYYNEKSRVAQLQSDLNDTKFQESFRFRKKSWGIITGMLECFMGTEDVHRDYKYKGTIVGLQEADARFNIMLMATQAIHQYAMLLLDIDLKFNELGGHLENVEQYRKQCSWAVSGTIQHDKDTSKITDENVWVSGGAPVTEIPQAVIPQMPQPVQDENEWRPAQNNAMQPQVYGQGIQQQQPGMMQQPMMVQQPMMQQQAFNQMPVYPPQTPSYPMNYQQQPAYPSTGQMFQGPGSFPAPAQQPYYAPPRVVESGNHTYVQPVDSGATRAPRPR